MRFELNHEIVQAEITKAMLNFGTFYLFCFCRLRDLGVCFCTQSQPLTFEIAIQKPTPAPLRPTWYHTNQTFVLDSLCDVFFHIDESKHAKELFRVLGIFSNPCKQFSPVAKKEDLLCDPVKTACDSVSPACFGPNLIMLFDLTASPLENLMTSSAQANNAA